MKNLKNKITIAVVGRSGSGKGTQAKRILEKFGKEAHHMETGRFLRNIVERDNLTARAIGDILKRGHLVPSWLAAFLWINEIVDKGVADKHLVFDGSPRTVGEAEIMDEVMEFHKRSLPVCVNVEASEKVVTRRLLLRGRTDDTPIAIRGRMDYFPKYVVPVIHYYEKRGRLITVDGNVGPDDVWKQVASALKKRVKGVWR